MADMIIVRSFAEIKSALNNLPGVQPGMVRTYRGQTRQYADATGCPILLPAIARPGRQRRYDRATVATMMDALLRGDVGDKLPAKFSLRSVWAGALVQHYASGSSFLDVSTDVLIALWFCAHRELRQVVLTDSRTGIDRRHLLAWHTDWTDGEPRHPVLYVFDAQSWTGAGTPTHGQSVQLLKLSVGRLVASQATRLEAQQAELIYADVDRRSDSNLAEFLRCTLLLHQDFAYDTVPGVSRPTTALFPAPTKDPIYRHLIAFPGAVTFNSGSAQLSHPLDLPRYIDDSDVPATVSSSPLKCERRNDGCCLSCRLVSEKVELQDPLFHAYLRAEGRALVESGDGLKVGSRHFYFNDASLILLRAPIVKFAPPLYTGEGACNWLQSVLCKDIAPEIPGLNLNNVYLELSPLDVYRIDRAGAEMSARAWWLVSNHPHYAVSLFIVAPGRAVYMPTLQFHYDPANGAFVWTNTEEFDRKGHEDGERFVVGTATQLLFLGLMLLRHLSPGFKVVPAHAIEPQGYDAFIFALLQMAPKRTLPLIIEPQTATVVPADPSGRYLVPQPLDGDANYIGPSDDRAWLNIMDVRGFLQLAETKIQDVKEPSFLAFAQSLIALEWAKAGERNLAIKLARNASEAAAASGLKGTKALMDILEDLSSKLPTGANVVGVLSSIFDA